MSRPRFTVVVPTRNRAVLARRCMARVLAQTFGDLELLVLENSDAPELEGFSTDPRVRVLPSGRVLSMPDNWERAVDEARGLYLMILSDRDLLVADALQRIWGASEDGAARMVHYHKADYVDGRLIYRETDGRAETTLARPALLDWYASMQIGPMIYSSPAHTEILRSIRRRYGRFFVGCAPDIASGPLLAASMDSYRRLGRHLAVGDRGEWSIGTGQAKGTGQAAQAFLREFDTDPYREVQVVYSIAGTVAQTLDACRRQMPELLAGCELNWQAYVTNVARELLARRRRGVDIRAALAELEAGAGSRYSRSDIRQALFLNRRWVRRVLRRRRRLHRVPGKKVRLELATAEEALEAIEALNRSLDASGPLPRAELQASA